MAKESVKNKSIEESMEGMTRCTDCGKIQTNQNFYISSLKSNKHTGRVCLCKNCLTNSLVSYLEETEDARLSIYYICRLMGFIYLDQIFESSYIEAGWKENYTIVQNGLEVWKKYIKTINSLKNYKGLSFENGEQIEVRLDVEVIEEINKGEIKLTEEELEQKLNDKQNKEDIIKIIGYDPFKNEKEEDKPYFYARLIDMIDENMKEDSMKLTSVISIIKSQKQVDKLDDAISEIMSNPIQMVERSGDIKSLSTTKKDMQKSILDTAKDNRISELYSGTKTAGANTLSGMVKKLKELNLSEAQVNLYDIETSLGMQQVARLSTKAIVEQLVFAENEYADMVSWQRSKLQEYENLYKKVAEENRKLKTLCNYKGVDYKNDVFVEGTYDEIINYDNISITKELQEKEFDEIVDSILPMNLVKYADKVIKEKEDMEKEKILNDVLNNK